MNHYLVYDIGGTSVKYSIMDEESNIIDSSAVDTPAERNGSIFQLLIEITKSYQKRYQLSGLALSVPGAVDEKSGYVHYAGQITDFIGKNIKEELAVLGLPVELENDANCAALAEKWKGHAQDCNSFVCLTIGTGIGGAIYLNGDLYRGRMGMAGEVGLMYMNASKPTETATFSRLGSTWNLLHKVFLKTGERITGEELFERYYQNDQHIVEEVDTFFDMLAVGSANLIHILAPEKILFGGGISGQPDFANHIRERLHHIRPECLSITEIDVCKFGNTAGQIGALYHFHKMR
ncbi:ROK family protein [Bacillus litorisediminis]|uniref:ROK family protein n=1 Tax=Bacillus litorisediminis TaxID=2922713 RepID=UPI001FB00C4A|nr:ROK family protein [Bacillus litorisediminis]